MWQLDRARWLTRHVCKELAKRDLSLNAAFARFDRRRTGRLTAASLLRGLRSLGIAVDSVAYDVLLLAFRTDRQGGFTKLEFRTHFEQISEADLATAADGAAATGRGAAKPAKKGGAEGALDKLREQEEREEKKTAAAAAEARADGLPERKRRSDGTPTTAEEKSHSSEAETAAGAASGEGGSKR